jgi:hypothetical protein
MTAPILQFKRGLFQNLPVLRAGEPGFTTDFYDLYVGSSAGNKLIGSGRFWTTETASTGGAVKVYEATANGTNSVSFAAPTNLASDITYTFPASPNDGYFLKTNSSGDLSWEEVVSSFTISADTGTNDTVNTGETLNFAGTTNEIETAVTNNQIQIGLPDNVTISGNLTINGDFLVEGSETIINTQRLDVEDIKIGIGSTSTPSDATANGGGIELYGTSNYNILWQNDTDSWEVNQNFSPSVDDTYDLGRSNQEWRNLYVDGLAELDDVNVSSAATIATADITTATIDNLTITNGSATNVVVGGALTVTGAIDGNGGADISGGETTLSSATISDLTQGRVVLAGASGSLEDSTNLTFGGGGLIIGAGGLNVTGVSTFSTTVDVNGLLEAIDVNVSGAATVVGNMTIGSLNVNDTAGNSTVIRYTGGERILENITVDAGSF